MADIDKPEADEEDPRHRLAQRYLQTAHDEFAAKEAAKPHSQRKRRDGDSALVGLLPSISLSTYLHTFMLMLTLALTSCATVWCYSLLNSAFIAGRIVALPAGVIFFATISYASAFYLGIVESTSNGHTSPDATLDRDWQDWFWTLPSTVGMLAIAVGLGYTLSFAAPQATSKIIGLSIWLVYPILQLSTLEAASPLAPLSLPILRTLTTRPIAWIFFYASSFATLATLAAIARVTWRDPPYFTVLVLGPVTAIVLLIYAWLLGQLARWLAIQSS